MVAAALILANLVVGTSRGPYGLHFYVNLVLFVPLLAGLLRLKAPSWDRWCGHLSYPVYLVHWQVGFLLVLLVPTVGYRGWSLFLGALIPTLAASWALYRFIERPVEELRRRVRSGQPVRSGTSDRVPAGGGG